MTKIAPVRKSTERLLFHGGDQRERNEKVWRRHNQTGDDDDGNHFNFNRTDASSRPTDRAALPSFLLIKSILHTGFGVAIALYILNQKHMLPQPLSSVVSRALFWPTLPITVARRIGAWETIVDDTVVMGGAPFGFAKYPEKLHDTYGVRGVVNLCEEYVGPIHRYAQLGMRQLYLPTTDHFEPTVSDMKRAVSFIAEHEAKGQKVYVHCRAGHGRSAAIVLAWLMYKQRPPNMAALQQMNQDLCQLRNVRKTLWKQRNIQSFHRSLKRKNETCQDEVDEILHRSHQTQMQ